MRRVYMGEFLEELDKVEHDILHNKILLGSRRILQGSSLEPLLEMMKKYNVFKLDGPNDWQLDLEGYFVNKSNKGLVKDLKNKGSVFTDCNKYPEFNPFYMPELQNVRLKRYNWKVINKDEISIVFLRTSTINYQLISVNKQVLEFFSISEPRSDKIKWTIRKVTLIFENVEYNAQVCVTKYSNGEIFGKLIWEKIFERILVSSDKYKIELSLYRTNRNDTYSISITDATIQEKKITNFNSNNTKGEDLLDIEKDAAVLANLVSLKLDNNSLSIGIFGDWGVGKSFFMNKVEKYLELNKNSTSEQFYNNIHIVHFNAWHYMDSNIYCSIANEIFKSIAQKMKIDKTYENKLIEENISRTKEEKEKIVLDIKDSKAKLNEIDNRIKTKRKECVESIISEFEKSDEFKKATEACGEIKKVYGKCRDLKKFIDKDNFKKFLEILEMNKFQIIILFIYILVILLYVIFGVENYIKDATKYLSTIPILLWSSKYANYFKTIVSKIQSLYEVQESMLANNKDRECIVNEIENKNKSLEVLDDKLKVLADSLNNNINKLKEGSYFNYLIQKRIENNIYENELSIINEIRKDFELINDYILSPNSSNGKIIDRIVIFIDDLDRCAANKVVEVLQAVHLFLSFESFVAIVGADEKWVNRCLVTYYPEMFKDDKSNINCSISNNYLEKIFLIPYRLDYVKTKEATEFITTLLDKDNKFEDTFDQNQSLMEEEIIGEQVVGNVENRTNEFLEKIDFNNNIKLSCLQITQQDKEYIKIFEPIMNASARRLTRFANIFRILKLKIGDKDNKEMVFLLVLGTLYTDISKVIFSEILMNNQVKMIKDIVPKDLSDIDSHQLKYIYNFIFSNEEIGEMELERLSSLIECVSKYSFNIN